MSKDICCTQTKIGLVLVEDEASRRAMEADDVSKEEGIAVMPTAILDPPEPVGVEKQKGKPTAECWYCGKHGHKETVCWKERADSEKTGSEYCQTEQGNRQRSHYVVTKIRACVCYWSGTIGVLDRGGQSSRYRNKTM